MFEIDRKNPWPPGIDLSTARATLRQMERDMKRIPQLAEFVRALKDTLHAIDKAEAKSPRRLDESVLTHARFTPLRAD